MKHVFDAVEDNVYPLLSEKERIRRTVRGILVNNKNEVYLLHVDGTDQFGVRNYYETPGGGIEEGEDELTTLRREMIEETGYSIKNIRYIGEAAIEYHLLKRWDVASMYYCECDKPGEKHLLDYEKALLSDPVWVPLDDILAFYDAHPAEIVGSMVHKRDRAVFAYLLDLLKQEEK